MTRMELGRALVGHTLRVDKGDGPESYGRIVRAGADADRKGTDTGMVAWHTLDDAGTSVFGAFWLDECEKLLAGERISHAWGWEFWIDKKE